MDHDPAKARGNLRKHGIDLARCGEIFEGPMLTREDPRGYDEQRLVSLGCIGREIVVLVWTDRTGGPRFISCRKATRHERQAWFDAFPPH